MIFISLLACFGGGDAPIVPDTTGPRPDIVLVSLDTTRADHLGCYGYQAGGTPVLDGLCAAGRRYDRAYSPAPITIPAHAALFTGQDPARLGIRNNGDGKLEDSALTLTEVLSENGYQTVGAVSAFVTTRVWGFGQGFDHFFDDIDDSKTGGLWSTERRGSETVDALLDWAEDRDPTVPTFAWLHLYDPHFPYSPPVEYYEKWKHHPYDGELAYVDDLMARVTAVFDPQETLFVVVADHGEGLGDHDELTHGLFVYDSTQRVPFFISGPGVEPSVVEETVGLIDVMPTVLAELDLEPPAGIDGQVMPGNPERPLYLESWALLRRFGFSPHVAVVDGIYKYIGVTRAELFDLSSDPAEKSAIDDPARLKRMAETLAGFPYERPSLNRLQQDPAVAMQLEALGYVEGNFVGKTDGPLPDAKDAREALIKSQWADHHSRKREFDKAEALLRELVLSYPDALEFPSRLASVLSKNGQKEEAVAVLTAAGTHAPEDPSIMAALAVHHAREGRFAEATTLFQSAADALPWAPGLRAMAVASQLSVPGGEEEAVGMGLAFLRQFPEDHGVAGLLGVAFARAEVPQAQVLLEQGLKANQPEPEVAYYLGVVAMKDDDMKRARTLFERELTQYPKHLKSAQALISVHDKKAATALILDVATTALLHNGSNETLLHAKAQALFNLKDFSACRLAMDLALVHHSKSSALILLDANLLKKEGKPEKGIARFEEAKAAKRFEDSQK
jgi:arylsulfatase A-like enzyme/Flp pilus assembly protein TadD